MRCFFKGITGCTGRDGKRREKQSTTTERLGNKSSSVFLSKIEKNDEEVFWEATDNIAVEIERKREKRRKKKRQRRPPWSVDTFVVPEIEGKSRFHDFVLPSQLMHAICDLDFKYCTPVQEKSLPHALVGSDLIGKANTGTGKTAVFLITIISRLLRNKQQGKSQVRALILAPTRELVIQIGKDARILSKYTPLSVRTVFGGADYQKQVAFLREKSCDIVIATPGRLLDFLGKNIVRLDWAEIVVLDEADRMLDMGFIPDVRRIMGRLPAKEKRQTLLFSATITADFRRLASQWCVSPVEIDAEPEQQAAKSVVQTVYLANSDEKYRILYNLITVPKESEIGERRIVVFTNMKEEGRRLSERLLADGIACLLLTGDVPQKKRTSRLERFRLGDVCVLVATDVAGRGIHIDGIELVVNYTLPYEPEDYIHRIGRTGRAGAVGRAISFACEEGSFYLPAIEELLDTKLPCVMPEDVLLQPVPEKNEVQEKELVRNKKMKRQGKYYKDKKSKKNRKTVKK